MNNVFTPEHILFDVNSTTQSEALAFIATEAKKLNIIDCAESFTKGLEAREAHDSTGFIGGIAIPHCKSKHVITPAIFVVRFAHSIEWNTMDDSPITTAISFAIPEQGCEDNLRMLTKLSRAMMKMDIRQALQQGDAKTVTETLLNVIDN
ncbi:PTS sugar transporter subunit IIA [Photobacterium iliopiscarium]|uniref:PTS sugar transporter subunit IIA n=1 Tax=Photobacterium iliopiscarium TaxID=56192 RepID=UPI002430CD4B|nr:PTS sugar transporter subunit IIA [Photobacterium iliopiscarium]